MGCANVETASGASVSNTIHWPLAKSSNVASPSLLVVTVWRSLDVLAKYCCKSATCCSVTPLFNSTMLSLTSVDGFVASL
nr:hypothetical protein [Lactococcus garvieae]